MKSARGVQGFVRYWGPQNGGCNEQSKGEYSALLKVFLRSASLRWFLDTYLTPGNIKALLGEHSSEIQQLHTQWNCFRLTGCAQDNSHFPILVWVKKQQFWQQEELQDGLFLTMKEVMSTEPVFITEEVTLKGPRNKSTRKHAGIDLHCTKTHGCAFVSKDKKVMKNHEKSCRPKPTKTFCKTKDCLFSTTHKSAMTNHVKTCAVKVVAAQPEIQSTEVVTTTVVQVFACPHRGCSMKHNSKAKSLAHQRTHTKTGTETGTAAAAPAAAAAAATATAAAAAAANSKLKKPNQRYKPKIADLVELSEDSDDGEQEKVSQKRNRGGAKKSATVENPAPVTKAYRCFECPKSHDSAERARLHRLKHENSQPRQSESSGTYRCLECPKSHDSAERARLHRLTHENRQPPPTAEALCPECKVYIATPALVKAHMEECRAKLARSEQRQSESLVTYRCLECPKSHNSADLARLHRLKHENLQSRPTVEVETLLCPECRVFSATPARVVAHMVECRKSLTCPECNKKCDSQALLIVHAIKCTRGELGAVRKRPREEDDLEDICKPTRNRNNKSVVKMHWKRAHVQAWLKLVELEEYDSKFAQEQVDGRILLQLTEEAIKSAAYGMKDTHAAKFLDLRNAFE